MKTFLIITCVIALSVLLSSCRKDKTDASDENFTEDIEMLVQKSLYSLDSWMNSAGESFPELYATDDGFPPDFLTDESYLDEPGRINSEDTDPERGRIVEKSFLRCLKKLDLEERQVKSVRTELEEYGKCKAKAVERLKTMIQELNALYRGKFHRLNEAYESGSLSKEKYRSLLKELKSEYRKALYELFQKHNIREVFVKCYHDFLHDLHAILNERQWQSFKECLR